LVSCRRFRWVVASALLTPAAPALAIDGGVVGWVESTRGVPLAGAVVSIFGKGIHGNRVTLSDSQGQFVLPELPPGSYTLRAISTGHEPSAAQHITVLPNREALFTVSLAPAGEAASEGDAAADDERRQMALREWLWLLRHKRRSVLETASHESDAWSEASKRALRLQPSAAGLLADLGPLAGQLELAASSSLATLSDSSFGAVRLAGRLTEGVRWSLGGLVAENEGRAWRMAAQFVINPGGRREIEAGAGYGAGDSRPPLASGLQPDLLQAGRTTGAVFARDRWRLGERVTATGGARYTYIGFLSDSHHVDAVVQIEVHSSPSAVVSGSITARSLAPGGDLLTLSTVTASPAITWARLDEGMQPSRTLRYEFGVDRRIGPGSLGAHVFEERTRDLLLTTFDAGVPYVRNNGGAQAQGFAVTVGRRFGSVVSGSVTYSFGRARHEAPLFAESPATAFEAAVFHDLVARLETVIDWSDTRVAASYRVNTMADDERHAQQATRFDVQLTQGLPFLQPLTRADWELLVAVRNMFYEASQGGFLEELAVQEPPTRVVGGISVRF
jgi:hypothetical protein